jgi:hypothetical protein
MNSLTVRGLLGHSGRPQDHGANNSQGTQNKFWEESHITPPKMFWHKDCAGLRESTGGMGTDSRPGMTTHRGGVGVICQRL